MKKNQKRLLTYFRLEEKLAQKLDKKIARAGFASRSEFFTAVAYVAIHDDKTENKPQNDCEASNLEKLPQTVTNWICDTVPHIREEEIQHGLHTVIDELLFPVLAMKGIDVAYENTWEDVRAVFHSKNGVWVTESDVREAFESFAAVNRRGLKEYREKQMLEACGE